MVGSKSKRIDWRLEDESWKYWRHLLSRADGGDALNTWQMWERTDGRSVQALVSWPMSICSYSPDCCSFPRCQSCPGCCSSPDCSSFSSCYSSALWCSEPGLVALRGCTLSWNSPWLVEATFSSDAGLPEWRSILERSFFAVSAHNCWKSFRLGGRWNLVLLRLTMGCGICCSFMIVSFRSLT